MTDSQLYEALKFKVDKVGKGKISVKAVCHKLNLNKGNYYDYLNRPESRQKTRRKELLIKIKQIHTESKEIYGAPKITRKLKSKGEKVSERLVGQIMKENGLRAHYVKQWTKTTKGCDFSKELENILARDFYPESPNSAWCTDITYIATKDEGFVYLTSVMDLYSRKIIAWTLTKTMTAEEVLRCLEIAKQKRNLDRPVVIHSDRGSQYVSKRYKELTAGMVTSYSDKGNPWDNACIEAFHALIKREWLNRFEIYNYEKANRLIFEYIEGFYNTWRIHSHCEYLSPSEFEKQYELAQQAKSAMIKQQTQKPKAA